MPHAPRIRNAFNRALLALFVSICASATAFTTAASAAVVKYSSEASWQTALGGPGAVALENFEGYLAGTPISSLPGLGVAFDPLAGGGQPSTYLHPVDNTGYGRMHLANFTNNNPTAYPRNNDIVLTVASGYLITALGFWNGDGQSSIYRADIYDASNNVTPVDFVQALSPTFAGFISDTAITKVVFLGNSANGDGWNHLDGLQTNATVVPLPAAAWFLLSALGALGLMGRRSGTAFS